MSPLETNILLFGQWDEKLTELGGKIITAIDKFSDFESPDGDHVVALTRDFLSSTTHRQWFQKWRQLNPQSKVILKYEKTISAQEIHELHRIVKPHRMTFSTQYQGVEPLILEMLEALRTEQQQKQMGLLLKEQEENLETLRTELEKRVEKRTRMLAESRHNLHLRSERLESLRRSLLVLQSCESLDSVEKILSQSIQGAVPHSWVKIVEQSQTLQFEDEIKNLGQFIFIRFPLLIDQQNHSTVYFIRSTQEKFRKEEHDFLEKISEAVAFSLDRLIQKNRVELLKNQWEVTFRSIQEPIALIDENYHIVQSNREIPPQTKCFEYFFQRSEACEGCQRGKVFRLENDLKVIEVQSQRMLLENNPNIFYVNLYTDVTEAHWSEKRLIDSSKKIELGLISSSLAHELNNPLGGILSYAQLILMDMAADHPLRADVQLIEDGARRCKEIIERLLTFSRNSHQLTLEPMALQNSIHKIIQFYAVKAHDLEIDLNIKKLPETPVFILGHPKMTSQLLLVILRELFNCYERSASQMHRRGQIEFQLEEFSQTAELSLRIIDLERNKNSVSLSDQYWSQELLKQLAVEKKVSPDSSPEKYITLVFPRPD